MSTLWLLQKFLWWSTNVVELYTRCISCSVMFTNGLKMLKMLPFMLLKISELIWNYSIVKYLLLLDSVNLTQSEFWGKMPLWIQFSLVEWPFIDSCRSWVNIFVSMLPTCVFFKLHLDRAHKSAVLKQFLEGAFLCCNPLSPLFSVPGILI